MDSKLAAVAMGVFCVGIFFFVGTFSTFMIGKEKDCARLGLMSSACFKTYPQFLHQTFFR